MPLLCTYREPKDDALDQVEELKLEPCWSEFDTEHSTSRSRKFLTMLNLNEWTGCKNFASVNSEFHSGFQKINIDETATWGVIGGRAFNPLTAKLFNRNFYPLEVVSRWRDPQLQVSENDSDMTKWRSTVFKYCWLMLHCIFNMFKMWYLMC